MKKKMKKEKENEKEMNDSQFGMIPAWSGLEVGDELTNVPNGSFRRHIVLAMALEAQRPVKPTELEAKLLARMGRARGIADASLDHRRGEGKPKLAILRGEVVSLMASVTGILTTHVKMRVPAVAARAAEVQKVVIVQGVQLARMAPQEAWLEVEKVRTVLEGNEQLFEALKRFVPEEAVVALFEANDRLGEALGLNQRLATATAAEQAPAHAYLRRCVTAYVRCIAASADHEDEASVRRALAALQPMAQLREANGRRKAKGLVEADGEEEGGVDEAGAEEAEAEADVVLTPPAVPPVTAPGGDIA